MPLLYDQLKQFAVSLFSIYQEEASKRANIVEKEPKLKWQLTNFEYRDTGIVDYQATGNYIEVPIRAGISHAVVERIPNLESFLDYTEAIRSTAPDVVTPEAQLSHLAYQLIATNFDEYTNTLPPSDELIQLFIDQLQNGAILYKATVHLKGIILLDEEVPITSYAFLRRPRPSDFERPIDTMLVPATLIVPSAVLEICIPGSARSIPPMQQEVEKYCTILRLQGLGSVAYLSYTTSTTAVVQLGMPGYNSTLSSPISPSAEYKYKLSKGDESRLRDIFHQLDVARTTTLYAIEREDNFLTIAYERYSEALLENASLERKVANAVMGLEALYSSDNSELASKLSNRIAKALSLLGKHSLTTRGHVLEAYKIRSKHVHGDQLSNKSKVKLQDKYGGVHIFLSYILDYLRISIATAIICDITVKENFTTLLDDSLLDPLSQNELNTRLSPAIKLFNSIHIS